MIVVLGQTIGMAAAFGLGGALVSRSDIGVAAIDHWRSAMLWLTVPLVAVALLIAMVREPQRAGVRIANASFRQACAELYNFRSVVTPLLIGLVMAQTAVCVALIWAAPMFSRQFALAADFPKTRLRILRSSPMGA